MPTLNQVRNKVNDWLADKWPILVNFQENYFAAHGRYWQGLATHNFHPEFTTNNDGDTIPDRLQTKPSDVSESWEDNFPAFSNITMPCQFIIDVYTGPQGPGWVATVRVKYNGVIYERAQNVGPDDSLSFNWRVAADTSTDL